MIVRANRGRDAGFALGDDHVGGEGAVDERAERAPVGAEVDSFRRDTTRTGRRSRSTSQRQRGRPASAGVDAGADRADHTADLVPHRHRAGCCGTRPPRCAGRSRRRPRQVVERDLPRIGPAVGVRRARRCRAHGASSRPPSRHLGTRWSLRERLAVRSPMTSDPSPKAGREPAPIPISPVYGCPRRSPSRSRRRVPARSAARSRCRAGRRILHEGVWIGL